MNATVFDTHQAVKVLRDAGADEAMAEAIVNTASAAAGAGRDMLATKADIAVLKAGLAALEGRIYRALWIQGSAIVAIFGGFIAIAAALKLL